MHLRDLDEFLQEACPDSTHAVYAVLLAGYPPTLSVRYSGRKGVGIIEKYRKSVAKSDLRITTNAPSNYRETKALFVFISLIAVGTIRDFRKSWYRELEDKAIRAYGRNFSPKQLVRLLPHSEIQFQLTLDLDTKEITDVKLSQRLEARLSSPELLGNAMKQASKMNAIEWATSW